MTRDPRLFDALHLAWQADCLPPCCRPALDRLVQELLLEDGPRLSSPRGAAALSRYLRFRIKTLSRDN